MSSESLREEGKEYFSQKIYAQAKEKFTEALKVDEENAILYANRSACNYALQRYVLVHLYCEMLMLLIRYEEAISDARKVIL